MSTQIKFDPWRTITVATLGKLIQAKRPIHTQAILTSELDAFKRQNPNLLDFLLEQNSPVTEKQGSEALTSDQKLPSTTKKKDWADSDSEDEVTEAATKPEPSHSLTPNEMMKRWLQARDVILPKFLDYYDRLKPLSSNSEMAWNYLTLEGVNAALNRLHQAQVLRHKKQKLKTPAPEKHPDITAKDLQNLKADNPDLLATTAKLLAKALTPKDALGMDEAKDALQLSMAKKILAQSNFVRAAFYQAVDEDLIKLYKEAGFSLDAPLKPSEGLYKKLNQEFQEKSEIARSRGMFVPSTPLAFGEPLAQAIGSQGLQFIKNLEKHGANLTQLIDKGKVSPITALKLQIGFQAKGSPTTLQRTFPNLHKIHLHLINAKLQSLPAEQRQAFLDEQVHELYQHLAQNYSTNEFVQLSKKIEDRCQQIQSQVAKKEKVKREKDVIAALSERARRLHLVLKFYKKWYDLAMDKVSEEKAKAISEKKEAARKQEAKALAADLQLSPDDYWKKHKTTTQKQKKKKKVPYYTPQPYYTNQAATRLAMKKQPGSRVHLNKVEAPVQAVSESTESESGWIEITKNGKTVLHPSKSAYRPLGRVKARARRRRANNTVKNRSTQNRPPISEKHPPQLSELPALPQNKKTTQDQSKLKPALAPPKNPWNQSKRLQKLKDNYQSTAPTIRITDDDTKPKPKPIQIALKKMGKVKMRPRVVSPDTFIPAYQLSQLDPKIPSFIQDLTAEKYQAPRTRKANYKRTVIDAETLADAPGFARLRVKTLLKTVNRKLLIRAQRAEKEKQRIKKLLAPRVASPASDAGEWETYRPPSRSQSMTRYRMENNPFAIPGTASPEPRTSQGDTFHGRRGSISFRKHGL